MEHHDLGILLKKYNSLYKEMDEVYHSLARHYGISDCALWILYIIRESEEPCTQSQICEQLSLSKQTVHSALKKLVNEGYLHLASSTGTHKNKEIFLTANGEVFVQQTVDHIIENDRNAFRGLSPDECTLFIKLFQKYICGLQIEARKILNAE